MTQAHMDSMSSRKKTKRDNALRMKMRLNQDVRGYAEPKSVPVATPWPRHWRTPEFVYLKPILIFSH